MEKGTVRSFHVVETGSVRRSYGQYPKILTTTAEFLWQFRGKFRATSMGVM